MLEPVSARPVGRPAVREAPADRPPSVDLVDETYIAAAPGVVARAVAAPAAWAGWWPGLVLAVTADRGPEGLRWSVAGRLVGSMEIWLEAVGAGTVLHWFLRAEPAGALRPRPTARLAEREVRRWKRHAFALKDRLEGAERVT